MTLREKAEAYAQSQHPDGKGQQPVVDAYERGDAAHTCHAIECEKPVPPRMLMCARHWGMLPNDHKKAIWRTYRPGQERNHALVTDAYLLAQARAVLVVAEIEDRDVATRMRQWDQIAAIAQRLGTTP